jgi:DNA (cytosine-5)-methyltransferase 1
VRQSGQSQQELLLGILESATRSRPVVSPTGTVSSEALREHRRQSTGRLPFKFIDLFAGIGGFRIALEKLGGQCVFTSEWDKYAQRTYREWFGEIPAGDIREINPAELPDHDILAAGFPCQPFSIAGVSKRRSLGRPHGFKCVDQGNLFFHLATIVAAKRPPILFLENVKNLKSHDKGRTWKVILETLEDLNYVVYTQVIDASSWVPQHRERVYIICFDRHVFGDDPGFVFPDPPNSRKPKMSDILEDSAPPKYTLSRHLWSYLKEYAAKHKAKGNGFGFGLANPDGISRTLSARYYKDGSEILIRQGRRNPRRLTPQECARLMGFNPDLYKVVVSDTQAYRQFGNAVVPAVVEAVGSKIVKVIVNHIENGGRCLLKTDQTRTAQPART